LTHSRVEAYIRAAMIKTATIVSIRRRRIDTAVTAVRT
jgi:hypothetical protein